MNIDFGGIGIALILIAVASCTAIVNKDDNVTKREITKAYIERGYVQREGWTTQWMKYEDFKEKYLTEKGGNK